MKKITIIRNVLHLELSWGVRLLLHILRSVFFTSIFIIGCVAIMERVSDTIEWWHIFFALFVIACVFYLTNIFDKLSPKK